MFHAIFKLTRTVFYFFDFFLISTLLYTLSFFPKKWNQWLGYKKWFQYWSNTFVRALGVELKVHQKHQYKLPKQYIVIANHPSALEDIGMPAIFKATFLAKQEVQKWWICGRIAQAAGIIFVQRKSKLSRSQAKKALIENLKGGNNIGLYPEGGCYGRRIHLPFKHGVFEIALKTHIPIIPVFIHYEAQVDFQWHQESLPEKIRQILRSKNKTAHFYIFDALNPKDFKSKTQFCTHTQNLYLDWQKKYLE